MIVEKRIFELPHYTTTGGETIGPVRIGWEAYGTLNAARDNAILVAHYFSGDSHAAGRYAADDAEPGYWDAIIGPGKAIDTDRYYVIASDTLVNLNAGSPTVTTTGPATINPATGKPWAMTFPVVTIRDFVNVQRALIDSLGIDRLHAVMGPSMGAFQTYEWALAYPDRVGRIMPVIGAGRVDANLVAWLNVWRAPILLDRNWNGGNYYEGPAPLDGLTAALTIVTLQAQNAAWSDPTFGRGWARETDDPAAAFDTAFAVEAALAQLARDRAETSDANHLLYLAKAVQLYPPRDDDAQARGLAAIGAPALLIYSPTDQLFPPDTMQKTAALLRGGGSEVDLLALPGTYGHLEGLAAIDHAAAKISAFLARPGR